MNNTNSRQEIETRTRKTRPLQILVVLIVVVVLGEVLGFVGFRLYRHPSHGVAVVDGPNSVVKESAGQTEKLQPNHMRISKISVDAKVVMVGLTNTGNMDVPTNVADTGLYKFGPVPGEIGSAVIAGHLDGPKGEPGVFINLNKLTKGDAIEVADGNGQVSQFVVRETRNYNPDAKPTEVFNLTDTAHLNLITCAGSWDTGRNQFSQRLVVFADKTK